MQKRWSINSSCYHFPLFKKLLIFFIFLDFTYLFLGGKGGRETSMWERYIHWLPLACPQLGTWPAPHACALTGNWTSDLLVHRPPLHPLSHTSQGHYFISRLFGVFGSLAYSYEFQSWLSPHLQNKPLVFYRDSAESVDCAGECCPLMRWSLSFLELGMAWYLCRSSYRRSS